MADRVTKEQLALAAYHRFAAGCTWEQAAAKAGMDAKTLRKWRKREAWRVEADYIIAELKEEGSGEAWGCLMRACRANDVTAAKEVLARLEGPVMQKTQVGGDPDNPLLMQTITLPVFGPNDPLNHFDQADQEEPDPSDDDEPGD